ncbi:hypothetical protein SAMN04487996_110145 [Dyadobacter soli]|uniref:Uncharacterized protein n=1 Tax=Dyadobacter soli TaxID=659014 RepID=A0A1G7KKC2_9BACT|nr:hypothetical protein SAMN04487996_110145 [Dyadobacter soli]
MKYILKYSMENTLSMLLSINIYNTLHMYNAYVMYYICQKYIPNRLP